MAIAFIVIALINPLFTPMGQDVLFSYFGRPYTLQGLAYGVSTAMMFVTIMLWFASYSHVMTSDKLTYLFGGVAPALTLVLTMVLRLITFYQRKAAQIVTARKCIGKSPLGTGSRERVEAGTAILSCLVTWALEGSVVMADSMRSRGYGLGKRSSYARYRLGARDIVALAFLVSCLCCSCVCLALGVASAIYLPHIEMAAIGPLGWIGLASFAMFLFLPFFLNMRESIAWALSLSRA